MPQKDKDNSWFALGETPYNAELCSNGPIYLIGFMGAGKSTLGRLLAEHLGYRFIDTDFFIENRFRKKVSELFATEGEERFRKKERVIIEELSGFEHTVISTGGGMPVFNNNLCEVMLTSGTVIYLQYTAQELATRLEVCKRTRPKVAHLSGSELQEYVTRELSWRHPIYTQAHLTFFCDWQGCSLPEMELLSPLIRALNSLRK